MEQSLICRHMTVSFLGLPAKSLVLLALRLGLEVHFEATLSADNTRSAVVFSGHCRDRGGQNRLIALQVALSSRGFDQEFHLEPCLA